MTLPLLSRRPARPVRPRIVSVTNYWSRDDAGAIRRRVLVSDGGRLVHVYFPDDHPVLVAYLRDLAVQAVSA